MSVGRNSNNSNRGKGTAGGDDLAERLRRLDRRLDREQVKSVPSRRSASGNAGFGYAMRLSTEFVSAILVGAALGWAIDRFLGIAPWGMIVFVMLGFAAGVLNVMRAAGRISDPHEMSGDAGSKDGEGEGDEGR